MSDTIFPTRMHANGDIAISNGAIKRAIKRNNKTADKQATGTTMESIKNLIDSIDMGKSLDIDTAFHEVFSAKVTQQIEDLKTDIASNLFTESKNICEGPVSYHGDDKEDAHDTAKIEVAKHAKE